MRYLRKLILCICRQYIFGKNALFVRLLFVLFLNERLFFFKEIYLTFKTTVSRSRNIFIRIASKDRMNTMRHYVMSHRSVITIGLMFSLFLFQVSTPP